MNIAFKTKRLKEQLSSDEHLKKEYGHLAKPIGRPLDAINGLKRQELHNLPGFHELKDQAKGIYAVTIKHPYRPVMRINSNQGLMILAVVDYHGKYSIINHYNKY